MAYTENLIRATDYAVFVKGMRSDWVAYPESGRIYSNCIGDFLKTTDVGGYQFLSFTLRHGGLKYQSTVSLHRAMWILCRGIPPYLHADVDHIDGDRRNNCLSNLRLVPHEENSRHRLTYEDAERIRMRREEGASLRSIAREFSLSLSTVWNVVSGNTHTHPPEKMICC